MGKIAKSNMMSVDMHWGDGECYAMAVPGVRDSFMVGCENNWNKICLYMTVEKLKELHREIGRVLENEKDDV